jgi:hypothetical protein
LEGTENKEEKIKKLLKQRDPVYEKFADIKVVTGVKPFEELIRSRFWKGWKLYVKDPECTLVVHQKKDFIIWYTKL